MGNKSSTPSSTSSNNNNVVRRHAQDKLSRQPRKDNPIDLAEMERREKERLRDYQRKKSERDISKRRLSQQWAEHQQANTNGVEAPEKENSGWFGM
jgi:hypothetical protein